MYLAVMLIIVAVLVFYNEYNKSMNIAEIGLLIVALIAIVRASMNYIHLNDTVGLKNVEGFSTARNTNLRKSGNKSKGKNQNNDVIVLESSRSKEYFDTDAGTDARTDAGTDAGATTLPQTTQAMLASLEGNKIDADAVNQVNSLLGISSPQKQSQQQSQQQSNFKNIPITTRASENSSGVESVFVPQIQIGKGAFDSLAGAGDVSMQGMNMTSLSGLGVPNVASLASSAAALGVGDNMSFRNTMKPTSNLWSSDLDYMDMSKNWSQSLADYNKGKWNPNTYAKASDYIDYYTPSAYGMNTPPNTDAIGIGSATSSSNSSKSPFDNIPTTTKSNATGTQPTTLDSNGQPRKLCGAYDDLSLDQAGNLVVQNYTQAKKWMPGYTYVPPVYWDVPQKHAKPCSAANPNARKLTGLVDRGLPINALELNPDGTMADTEDTVSLTNVGSIIPQFNYQETPFSKPYV